MTGKHFPLLLRHGSPFSGESLPSFVARLAQLNYYEPITLMKSLLFEGLAQDKLEWPIRETTYERLFDLTGVDPFILHATTGHSFADVLTPLEEPVQYLALPGGERLAVLLPQIAQQQLRPAHAVQFCPLCLRKKSYHRIAWMPMVASVCIQHRRMLVAQCPGCQKSVSVREIVEHCRCRKCGADLRVAKSTNLGKDDFGLLSQRFIRWCLGLGRAPMTSLPRRLSPRSFRAALYFLTGLVDSIRLLGSGWEHLYQPVTQLSLAPFDRLRGRPTPDQSYRLYAKAFKALVKWPQGFYGFLAAYKRRDNQPRTEGLLGDLGRLYAKWLNDKWLDPELDFVQRALSQYLVDTYVTPYSTDRETDQTTSMSPKTTAFISRSAAAQLLGVSARTIDRLVDIGFLIKYTVDQGEPRRYGAVRQAEVLILRLHWGEGVPLADAVRWFGVTKSLLLEFVNAGVLTPGQTADLNNINALASSKEDLDSYYCRLTKGVRSPWKNRSSLTETTRALSRLGLKLLDVLKLVADGRLDVWAPTNSPSVAQLTFDPRDVAALLKGPDLGRRLIDSEQAVHRLGVDPQTLFKWRATGQISAVLSYDLEQYYDPHELDAFMADLIPSHEAAKMWGVEVGEVETWCWNLDWGIHSATGTSLDGRPLHLFRRRDVERLQATFSASDGLDSPEVLQSH